jgi:hypothetical protein
MVDGAGGYGRIVTVGDHGHNERRSLAYHRAVAERLATDASLLARARNRVAEWEQTGAVHHDYVQAWGRALRGSAAEVASRLIDESEQGAALRQVSPFAGALTPRERWAIWRASRGGTGDPRAA